MTDLMKGDAPYGVVGVWQAEGFPRDVDLATAEKSQGVGQTKCPPLNQATAPLGPDTNISRRSLRDETKKRERLAGARRDRVVPIVNSLGHRLECLCCDPLNSNHRTRYRTVIPARPQQRN